jgi:SAM-dependent methyltransferase
MLPVIAFEEKEELPAMGDHAVFENLKTFEQWDADYYPPAARKYYDKAIRFMLRCLRAAPGDLVLDAGCGPGEHSVRAAREGCRVHAIDISAAALAEAKRRSDIAGTSASIQFEPADLTGLSFPDQSFERVFSWGVVIHIPEAEKALKELARILKPQGRLALYVTNGAAWDYRLLRVLRKILRRPEPETSRLPLGEGCRYRYQQESLWVWRFDIQSLTRFLAGLGLRRVHRIAGSMTELQRRVKGPLRSLGLHFNNLWYGLGLPAGPCVTNLLVFEKTSGES